MKCRSKNIAILLNAIPIVSVLLFFIIFIYASTLYPGGTPADSSSIGYDWMNNYWCNLTNKKSLNGLPNPSRSYAISGLIILCIGLFSFFLQFAQHYSEDKLNKTFIKYGGILSMTSAVFIASKFHDQMTFLSSIFGLFVVIGIVRELYQNSILLYRITGLICLSLLVLNIYVYYSSHFLNWLPLLQKITFAVVLLCVLALNLQVRKEIISANSDF